MYTTTLSWIHARLRSALVLVFQACSQEYVLPAGCMLLGGITCSAIDSAYSYTFIRSAVCLCVVCHIRAPCLNRTTDLDAIWQVHLWGPTTHCVKLESLIHWGRADLGCRTPAKLPHCQFYASTWQIPTRNCTLAVVL